MANFFISELEAQNVFKDDTARRFSSSAPAVIGLFFFVYFPAATVTCDVHTATY